MDTESTPSLTPSRSPTPEPPIQPDHFYSLSKSDISTPPSPDSLGRSLYDPEDDPFATRGIPVFKPTMDEFADFEGFMTKIECWGNTSGIVKVIPPKEWTDSLPPLNTQLANVKMRNPIEQHMLGRSGLYRQQNIMKNRHLSVREWAELCAKEDLRAPGVDELGLKAPEGAAERRKKRVSRRNVKEETPVSVKDEEDEEVNLDPDVQMEASALPTPPVSEQSPHVEAEPNEDAGEDEDVLAQSQAPEDDAPVPGPSTEPSAAPSPSANDKADTKDADAESASPAKRKRRGPTRAERDAALARRADLDEEWIKTFDPKTDWFPSNTNKESYTPEVCAKLERRYWRNLGLGKPAWYGADMEGSLFTDETKSWNVAHLPSTLSRLLPASSNGLPGVNTPYLYFGMWRATFAWHVEDMDLFSINYIHFGAGKFWYAIPQSRAVQLENTMRSYFPKDTSQCPQFLRHKSFLASPTLLSQSSCRPNVLVQHAGEFVITYPRGYHAGFNLGFNCAESVNFALDSWLDLGRKAQACRCIGDSVRIDVDQLLQDREVERNTITKKEKSKLSKKRKPDPSCGDPSTSKKAAKRIKVKADPGSSASTSTATPLSPSKITLRVPPRPRPKPAEPDPFPCCLCVSMDREGLLRVHETSIPRLVGGRSGCTNIVPRDEEGKEVWMAHEGCAKVVPETWVDEVDVDGEEDVRDGQEAKKEKVVFGVDGVVKDRWNLKCSACAKMRNKIHGAPIQCTKGKCSKAFHISCAQSGEAMGIRFAILREVEKQVVIYEHEPVIPVGPDLDAHEKWLKEEEDGEAEAAMTGEQTVGIRPELDAVAVAKELAQTLQPMDVDFNVGSVYAPPHDVSAPAVGSAQPISSESMPVPRPPVPPMTEPLDPAGLTPKVIKTITKSEVELLCSQHNPLIAAQKKAQKMDKVRIDLLALPEMARIKLRVTAGVFEVSLVRVIEERQTVEVLWDGGVKKEFKWGSVVWGNMEGQTVGQKPSVPAPEPAAPRPNIIRLHVPNYANQYRPPAASSSSNTASQPAPPGAYAYGSKSYGYNRMFGGKPFNYTPGPLSMGPQQTYSYYSNIAPKPYQTPGYTASGYTAPPSSTNNGLPTAPATYSGYPYGATGYRYPGGPASTYPPAYGTSNPYPLTPYTTPSSATHPTPAAPTTLASAIATAVAGPTPGQNPSTASPLPTTSNSPTPGGMVAGPSSGVILTSTVSIPVSTLTQNETTIAKVDSDSIAPPAVPDLSWVLKEIQQITSLSPKELEEALRSRPEFREAAEALIAHGSVLRGEVPYQMQEQTPSIDPSFQDAESGS